MSHPAQLSALPRTAFGDPVVAPPRSTPITPILDESGPPHRGRSLRWSAAAASVALTFTGATVAWQRPTNEYAELPGPVLDLASRVTIDGTDATVTPIDGSVDGLTVSFAPLDVGDVIRHWISGDSSTIVPESQIKPAGVSAATYNTIEKAAYVDGGQLAAAVAERTLGYNVSIVSDGLEIDAVEPGSPAEAAGITVGDVLTAVNGTPITGNDQLSSAVQLAASADSSVTLSVRHLGTEHTVTVTPAHSAHSSTSVIGVVATPANPTVTLPVPVTIDASGVVGPSAGLMTALTVYDKLSPMNLVCGRRIAGTGTISADGTVGEIGGIEAKARAAEAAGANLFLAPASQAAAARAVLGNRVPVIGVTTFADALAALG